MRTMTKFTLGLRARLSMLWLSVVAFVLFTPAMASAQTDFDDGETSDEVTGPVNNVVANLLYVFGAIAVFVSAFGLYRLATGQHGGGRMFILGGLLAFACFAPGTFFGTIAGAFSAIFS